MCMYIRMYVLIRRTASNLTASSLFILLPSTRRDGLINPGDFPPCGINPGRDRPTICSRFSSVFFLPSSLPPSLPYPCPRNFSSTSSWKIPFRCFRTRIADTWASRKGLPTPDLLLTILSLSEEKGKGIPIARIISSPANQVSNAADERILRK